MPSRFMQALHSYQDGVLSREDLVRELELQLALDETEPRALLADLNDEQASQPLPGNIHLELVRLLLGGRDASLAAAWEEITSERVRPEGIAIRSENGAGRDGAEPPAVQRRKPGISVGSVLQGRFRLIEPIAEGAMSTVYRAIDLRNKGNARAPGNHFAVKLLPVPMSDFMPALRALQAQLHALHRVPHPNIVRVVDCDHEDRIVFVAMELLRGESLKRWIVAPDFKGVPLPQALRIVGALAEALEFAHRLGVVHGDLKPANILIAGDEQPKVTDFGIGRLMTRHPGATLAGDERPKLSALTPPYASPEMLDGADPDPRDDVYALACIAHELITGRHPFDRRVANEARDSGIAVTRHFPLTTAQFRAIKRGLDFERSRRTPSARQFFAELSARPRIRVDVAGVLLGALVIGVLLGGYYLDHGRILRWIESHRNVSVTAPAAGEMFRDCPTCPLMKALTPGRFEQGRDDDAPFEHPRHAVTIGYPIAMGVYEVTVGEFKEFADATAHRSAGCQAYNGTWQPNAQLNWDHVGYTQTATHPVACVSWRDAHQYAAWLSARTGQRYRLPSESEWEYAARAGSALPAPWAGDPGKACASANVADQSAAQQFPGWKVQPCSDGYVYTAPVGSFKPNPFGLYDMLGNVFEWVEDCWHGDYQGAPANGSAWLSGDCRQRGMRGGSWFTAPPLVSTSARNRFEDTYRSNSVGFRLVREIKPL